MVTTISSNGNRISAAAISVASRLERLTEDQDVTMEDASEEDSRAEPNPSGSKRMRPNPLKFAGMRTGICYDSRMRFHATLDPQNSHPEDPRRIFEIYRTMCDAGLVDDPMYEGHIKSNDIMLGIRAREVTMEEAALVHTPQHWNFLSTTASKLQLRLVRVLC
jgi:histone deacetylase 6